jgi:hypothetical protein
MCLFRTKIRECSYTILYTFRYMEALEDAMNLPLCGIFLFSLTSMCLFAFSVITVKYSHNVLDCRRKYV